ncbi:prepilin-type N-terminal cleavage/methylation domain-containing protein [Hazenella sp. IB182357]|uniref:Prepilin-type N-terminal cleavage/methylation domain-containing protein n=1 Tax=Polycladospora coralii TaxID=2771432 RepID=A0A926N5T7_9BACL|nr:prepilin-type N-terminal cleavage/methylation domain-containing protein [Polycladospora coralii]MBD1371216.1 prepilin-type N-terminal cleavage/methylation domain-containing protein [Polycladospora coralii]
MHLQDDEGFTLIEMLVVLFIIGLILAIMIPNLRSAGEKAQTQAYQANRQLIGSQLDHYYLEFGKYPVQLSELVEMGYLKSIPNCPGGKGKYSINPDPNANEDQRVVCKQ